MKAHGAGRQEKLGTYPAENPGFGTIAGAVQRPDTALDITMYQETATFDEVLRLGTRVRRASATRQREDSTNRKKSRHGGAHSFEFPV